MQLNQIASMLLLVMVPMHMKGMCLHKCLSSALQPDTAGCSCTPVIYNKAEATRGLRVAVQAHDDTLNHTNLAEQLIDLQAESSSTQ